MRALEADHTTCNSPRELRIGGFRSGFYRKVPFFEVSQKFKYDPQCSHPPRSLIGLT
jgi:hypothetical protein